LLLFLLTVYALLKFDVLWILLGVTALSLYVLPLATTRDPFRVVPWEITVIMCAPMILHYTAQSRTLIEHVGWWGDFTSLAMAFSLSTIGFLMTVELQIYTDVRMNRPFAVLFVVLFALAAAGFWEVGHFIADQIYDTSTQGTNAEVMTRLLWILVGGILMGFFYAFYLKAMSQKRKKTLGLVTVWEAQS